MDPLKSTDPLLEARGLSKWFGTVEALQGIDLTIGRQEIVGLVGDNGAGKSTLIKILTGYHRPDRGEIWFEGRRVDLRSPKDARALGIETVYQDLALVEELSIARNFFLGAEPIRRVGPLSLLDLEAMRRVTREALQEIGITRHLSPNQAVASLSGGERQAVAIGRAVHFGAKLLILDEPTSALSVHETNKVLGYIRQAKEKGLSVIFITHNLFHVHPVADRLVVLEHGRKVGDFRKGEISLEDLTALVAHAGRG